MKRRKDPTAEASLFLMVKSNKKQLRYVSSTLSELSDIMSKINKSNLDERVRKLTLRLVYKDRLENVNLSVCLDEVVKTHLLNACKARYMKAKEGMK